LRGVCEFSEQARWIVANEIPIDQLEKIVGKDNLKVELQGVFLSPENSSAASEIVRLANQQKFRILPSGSGSIFDSSRLAAGDFVVLRSDKLNAIIRVVPEDLYVILQAGFPLKELGQHVESHNLFYPLCNASSVGTIGGAVAANLKGKSEERTLQTSDYLLSLEIVDPQGQILKVGAKTFKSVTGYDLPRLYAGSWGTLGFITEVGLRLVPARKRKDFPSITFEPPGRGESSKPDDPKGILSSRIKQALDPSQVFISLDSLA
jgi:FAD/FMN-containing dehydrogenase